MSAVPSHSAHLRAAWIAFHRVGDSNSRMDRCHFLGRAADALHAAGLHGLAAIAEDAIERIGGSDSDVAAAMAEVERLQGVAGCGR